MVSLDFLLTHLKLWSHLANLMSHCILEEKVMTCHTLIYRGSQIPQLLCKHQTEFNSATAKLVKN